MTEFLFKFGGKSWKHSRTRHQNQPAAWTHEAGLEPRTCKWWAAPRRSPSTRAADSLRRESLGGGRREQGDQGAVAGGSVPAALTGSQGVGSLSLLQGVFPTQEWSRGLLHCRRLLYQLSHRRAGPPRFLDPITPLSSTRSSRQGDGPARPHRPGPGLQRGGSGPQSTLLSWTSPPVSEIH